MERNGVFEKAMPFVKLTFMILALLINIVITYAIFTVLNEIGNYYYNLIYVIVIIFITNIILSRKKLNYKFSWIIFLSLLPITGTFFYLIFGTKYFSKKFIAQFHETEEKALKSLDKTKNCYKEILDADLSQQAKLISNESNYITYKNTEVEYYPVGEDFHKSLLTELSKAKKFIFMQYFIVSEGKMHREIMDILIEKAKEGVEVFYSYDVAGSVSTLPKNFKAECEANGIQYLPFNSDLTKPYTFISYRDHRKITVVDGKVGFTGGVNLGDEYINHVERFGHWKDMAVKLEGDAVEGLSLIFLKTWSLFKDSSIEFDKYLEVNHSIKNNIFVTPFDSGPIGNDVAEKNYIRMISSAKEYVYIATPYLILSHEVISAINLARTSGVDVRILVPHIPDKKFIFKLTKSFYTLLLKEGVKVYEYKPGFVHGKVVITDDKSSLVGTINFDYRSLLWNFECGALIFDETTTKAIKKDFENTFEISIEKSKSENIKTSIFGRIYDAFLQLLAPLL